MEEMFYTHVMSQDVEVMKAFFVMIFFVKTPVAGFLYLVINCKLQPSQILQYFT